MHVFEDVSPTELSIALRALIIQPEEDRVNNRFSLRRWFPYADPIAGTKWKWTDKASLRTFTEAMPARAFDTEARIKGREGWQEKEGKMQSFAEAYVLSETEMLFLAAALENMTAEKRQMLSEVYDDVARGFRAFEARMEILYAELLTDATATVNENGVDLEPADFARSATHEASASTVWSDTANADPFGDEQAALDVLADQDLDPSEMVVLTRRSTYREWANTDEVKAAIPSDQGRATDARLAEMRRDDNLPPIVIYDRKARAYGASADYLLTAGDWIYLPANSPLGATQLGTPITSRMPTINVDVQAAGQGPVAYVQYEENPPQSQTVIDFLGFPVMYDPDATFKLTV